MNAWEMELSEPSARSLRDLSRIFRVSSDYILGIRYDNVIDISGLNESDIELIEKIISFR